MSQNKTEQFSLKWPDSKEFRKSIRLEFSIYISLVIVILMGLSGYIITNRYVETVTENVVNNLLVQARSYTGQAGKLLISTAQPDALLLDNICRKFVQNNSDLYWAGIASSNKLFVAHTDIKKVVTQSKLEIPSGQMDKFKLGPGETMAYSGDSIYITVPIRESDIEIGTIALASSDHAINEVRMTAIYTVGSITIILVLLGVPLTMFVMNRKLKPISLITETLRSVDFTDFNLNPNIKSKNEFGYLSETLKVMGVRIKQANQEVLERERITRELEIAREIQRNILPTKYPRNENFEFSGVYKSAREIGGDYFDFFECGHGRFGFLVADVSGKSLPGMLVMLLTRDIVQKLSRTIDDPARLLVEVNKELLQSIKKGMFVTMFIAIIDERNNRVSFASAGHNPLVILRNRDGRTEQIKSKGFPLGMVSPKQFEERLELVHTDLNAGDCLIQYSDGINEGQNDNGEEYGMTRFVQEIEKNANSGSAEFVSRIMSAHDKFVGQAPQYDDITLLVMKWHKNRVDNTSKEKILTNEQIADKI